MKILIHSATILNKASSHHRKKKNVLIQNGRIADITDRKPTADKVIDGKGMFLTPGWFDLGTLTGDPGHEHNEDLTTLAEAAMAGGFTALATLPNTQPAVQSKNEVAYLKKGNKSRLVQIYPLAAVTKGNKGEELTEMIDLHEAGAAGFTDGLKPIWHTDIFLKALQYVQKFGGIIIDQPQDIWLNLYGQMHEGIESTSLGLKGMPRIAEELPLQRNLELLRYAGGRLHVSRISTGGSVDLIRAARKAKLKVTCDITAYQPLLGDDQLADFDTNLKVNPPLREKKDRDALLRALKDNTIDIISSGHQPHDAESKSLEFDQADFGMINLQTFASQIASLSAKVPLELLVEKITNSPRALLDVAEVAIEKGEDADLTLFDPARAFTLNETTNRSRSINSPWFGKTVKGSAVAVFANGEHQF